MYGLVLLTSAALLGGFALGGGPVVAASPNVVLILTDDQGWGDVHSHGNDKIDTPTMDQFAASGARFDRFFVSPMCGPTRASVLTGRWNLRTGASWGVARQGDHATGRGHHRRRAEKRRIRDRRIRQVA